MDASPLVADLVSVSMPLSHIKVFVSPDDADSITFLPAASKFMIDTGAGVIDADYRGVVFVLLFNHSDKDFQGLPVSSSEITVY